MWQKRARYCPLCGSDLEPRQLGGRERRGCVQCKFVLYTGPASAAAAVVLNRRGQVLLIKRGIEPYKGQWAFPAGYQEIDEHPIEAMTREVFEEAGLRIVKAQLLDVLFIPDDPRKPANVAVYRCVPADPDQAPNAGDDARDARWFDLDDLPEDLAFPNNRAILEAIRAGEDYPGATV